MNRRRPLAIYGSLVTAICWTANATSALPVMPDIRGHGTHTVAGSGRNMTPPATTIIRVTNKNNSGPGSLRNCVEASGPRVCLFDLSGRIRLTSEMRIKNPYLTIAGQTAPKPGILLTGAGIRVMTHDVLIQHIEVRPGDDKVGPAPEVRDGLTVAGDGKTKAAYNVVVDHVSVSWSLDENVSTWYPDTRDVTFSHMIAAEGLEKSIHPKGPHSKGMLIGDMSERISIYNCLFAHNVDRNAYFKPGSEVEFVNNLIYNWGGRSGSNIANVSDYGNVGVPTLLTFTGNFYKPGPQSSRIAPLYGTKVNSKTRAYVSGNVGPSRPADAGSEWLISSMPSSPYRSLIPVASNSGIPLKKASDAYAYVLSKAGSRPAQRSAVDKRIVSEVQNGGGSIKDCVSNCSRNAGGWPSLTTVYRRLQIPKNPNGDDNLNGYTNLEEWLFSLAREVA